VLADAIASGALAVARLTQVFPAPSTKDKGSEYPTMVIRC
jgi:hypothetical protein